MSEIEKAIMYWEEFKQEAIDMIAEGKYSNSVLEKQIPMCNTALAALREQAERSRGCVWCKIGLRFECYLVDDDGHTASIQDHVVQTVIADFCPICGKRLEVEREKALQDIKVLELHQIHNAIREIYGENVRVEIVVTYDCMEVATHDRINSHAHSMRRINGERVAKQ